MIASQRLTRAGLVIPRESTSHGEPELELYRLLEQEDPDEAFPRYNALLDELDSFLAALDLDALALGKSRPGEPMSAGS